MCKRGDIYWYDYGQTNDKTNHEQTGIRPVVIVQNNKGNQFSPTVIIAAITSQLKKINQPTHVVIDTKTSGLNEKSMILLEQVKTVSKNKLQYYTGHLSKSEMKELRKASIISLGIDEDVYDYEEEVSESIVNISYIQETIYMINRNREKYEKYKDVTFKIVSDSLLKSLNDYCNINNIDKNKLKLQWRNDNIQYLKKVSC